MEPNTPPFAFFLRSALITLPRCRTEVLSVVLTDVNRRTGALEAMVKYKRVSAGAKQGTEKYIDL
jgi:hypothetical protein